MALASTYKLNISSLLCMIMIIYYFLLIIEKQIIQFSNHVNINLRNTFVISADRNIIARQIGQR